MDFRELNKLASTFNLKDIRIYEIVKDGCIRFTTDSDIIPTVDGIMVNDDLYPEDYKKYYITAVLYDNHNDREYTLDLKDLSKENLPTYKDDHDIIKTFSCRVHIGLVKSNGDIIRFELAGQDTRRKYTIKKYKLRV